MATQWCYCNSSSEVILASLMKGQQRPSELVDKGRRESIWVHCQRGWLSWDLSGRWGSQGGRWGNFSQVLVFQAFKSFCQMSCMCVCVCALLHELYVTQYHDTIWHCTWISLISNPQLSQAYKHCTKHNLLVSITTWRSSCMSISVIADHKRQL